MRKLGNILTGSKLAEFDPIFNKCMECSETDNGLPTLVIGLTKARSCIDGFDILKKDYPEQNKWWTYAKMERRSDYLTDLARFQEYCIRRETDMADYEYVDFTSYPLTRIKKFIKYMRSADPKLILLTKESQFMFIYSRRYRKTWGLSLTLCDYLNIDPRKVVREVRSNRSNRFVDISENLSQETRKVIGGDTHRFLPVIDALKDF